MSTTVGASAGVRMRGNYLFTLLFEDSADRRPRVAGFDEMTPGGSELRAARRVLQQRDHGIGEFARLIGAAVMQSRLDAESFRADGRRDHRTRHGQSFKNLQPRTAASPERHNVDRASGNRRPDVADRAGHSDT